MLRYAIEDFPPEKWRAYLGAERPRTGKRRGAKMAFDKKLAERIRDCLARRKNIEAKKLFGGIGFLLNGNMLVGVWKDSLIARVGPDAFDDAQANEGLGAGRTGRRRGRRAVGGLD
jgi:hypothetical protein